ncbi:MAG: bifunctional (p)ppGpp synthetase/guanosine-3',5'-bis(diphosphate) 3'-pyrophosphohydrolase [Clostridiales bacterium]|nr:bifunctional (p)ppGpp synthetase/guanosine-3',5'-bis(diphosphate) 3'-pyrophosphohydrolase [Clostridiales bacterium]
MPYPFSLTHAAITFATQAHHGQHRKCSMTPYIVHPFEVGQLLTLAKQKETVIVAGLLHDTLEDTPTTPETLQERFGLEVLTLVQHASENKSLSWEQRKQNAIDFLLRDASYEDLMIACADRLSNLRAISHDLTAQGDDPAF